MYSFQRILAASRSLRIFALNKRCFRTTPIINTFWERDPKGGYDTSQQVAFKERIRVGIKELKKEIALWKNEIIEDLESDPIMIFRPGETDIIWKFGKPEALEQWVVTADSDHGEGFSKCSLSLTNTGRGLFSGELSTRVPKNGRVKRAGYCNIKTLPARKSFKRESYLNWGQYNMLVLKVRGDGRPYLINLASKGYFDVLWNDVYHYVLYTRGGPYWQVTKIPLSKFILSSKGRVQDIQAELPRDRITSFGISAGDKVNGPFELEIEYIGLEYDPNHTEEFAYEMYKMPKYIVAT